MLAQLTARQAVEIEAFVNLEGLPSERADLRMGQICAAMYGAMLGSKANVAPIDFIHDFDKTEDDDTEDTAGQMTEETMRVMFDKYNRAVDKMSKDKPIGDENRKTEHCAGGEHVTAG